MQIRCPSCGRPLDIAVPESTRVLGNLLDHLSSVQCPDCGLVSLEPSLGLTKSMPEPPPEPAPQQVAHFTLLRRLGQGGFGEVWLARDNHLGRDVALKLPTTQGPEMASLLYEAKTAAGLRHPHIVSVYEVGTDRDRIFIASEYIDGLTLRDLLTAGRPTRARTVDLVITIARALHYAHQRGIVHRDIKPANILINKEGQPFITDFGIAKRLSADATISLEGQVIGTARYMAPEQAAGKSRETDHRADLYSLGVLLFEMFTGDVPFRGNVQAILHQKLTEDPPSPRTMAPDLERDLETICLKCLEREPDKRYASAELVAQELERFRAGEPIVARPITRLERGWRWCRKRPDVASLVAGLFLTLTIGLAAASTLWRRAEANRAEAETNWQRAEDNADSLRRSLYRARMNQVAIHHASGNLTTVRTFLDELARDPFLQTLRGFEWRYYAGQAALVQTVANHGNVVTDVALSHDGDLCASIGRDPEHVIRVWDVRTGELVRTLQAGSGQFQTIEFSPVSGLLASGSTDGFVRLWNPRLDARLAAEVKHGPSVKRIRFSPNGKLLVSCGDHGGLRVWSARDLSAVDQFPGGQSIEDVRFLPYGEWLIAAVNNGQLRLWNVGDRQPTPPRSIPETVQAMAVSDDGNLLVAGDYHGGLSIISLEVNGDQPPPPRDRIQTFWGRIDDVEFIPRTNCVAVAASDGRTHVFDVHSRREIRQLETHHLSVGLLALAASGRVLATGSIDGSVSIIHTHQLTKPVIFWHEHPVRDVAFLPGGEELLVADNSGRLWRWRLNSGEAQLTRTGEELHSRTLSVHPGGRWVATGGQSPWVAVRDVESLEVIQRVAVPAAGVSLIRCSSQGGLLAIATVEGPLRVYQTGDWSRPAWEAAHPPSPATALAFSPDDRWLAVGWQGGEVALLETATGKVSGVLTGPNSFPSALAFCDEGRQLAVATDNGEVHLWEVASRTRRRLIRAHTGQIKALAVLPGGQTLASGGRDRDLKLWDVESGELLTTLAGHLRQIFTLAVSPDGHTLVSGSLEGDVRVWRAPPVE